MELEVIKKRSNLCAQDIASIEINSNEDYDKAVETGKRINGLLKSIDDQEKLITKPMNEALKAARDQFRPYKEIVEGAKDLLKSKCNDYQRRQAAENAANEAKIMARVEKGTITEKTATTKLATQAENTVGSTTSVLKVTIVDIKLIPEEFLVVNETAIKKAYREGREIPGVTCAYEQTTRF